MKTFKRILAAVLSLSLINATLLQTAQAALVSTEQVARIADEGQAASGRERLAAALSRDDVRAALERQGVDPSRAVERVAALTDDEAARLANQIGTAPAGGLIEEVMFVFFVLLITDILGFTKVYPFTRTAR
jgi:hypothetical protein